MSEATMIAPVDGTKGHDIRLGTNESHSGQQQPSTGSGSAPFAAVKSNQVLPAAPAVSQLFKESKSHVNHSNQRKREDLLSFTAAFGSIGVPLVLILVACVVWTTWLIFVALAPNEAANWWMDTGSYDNGQMWLIIDANPTMTLAGAVGLVVVDVHYLYVALRMLRWRSIVTSLITSHEFESPLDSRSCSVPPQTWLGGAVAAFKRGRSLYKELTAFRGSKRKRWNVLSKILNLAMQMAVFLDVLESGSPVALVYGYATLIALNSLSCAVNILSGRFSAVTEVLMSSIFDWAATVVFPIVVLNFCHFNFNFDRAVYATYLEKLPTGSFEQMAREFADPSEIALFRLVFDSLRISTLLGFVLRIGMNLSFCYRAKRIADVLVWLQLQKRGMFRSSSRRESRSTRMPQKPVSKPVAVMFITFSVTVWTLAYHAITGSQARCAGYPECVVYSYHWGRGDGNCACRILIDADRAPKTLEEWLHPEDVYEKVKVLAASGELRSLQVINRQLLELPEELRTCHQLAHIQLIYTSIQRLPPWAKEFEHLEILHLEGKQGSQNLMALPEDLFSEMPRLALIHIAVQWSLAVIPPLTGVPNLQALTLAWVLAVRNLPSFDRVPNLQRLILTFLPQLERLPDLAPLQSLVNLSIARPSHICCNGFRGSCDLSDNYCLMDSDLGIPAATCLTDEPFLGNVGTQAAFEASKSTICQKSPSDSSVHASVPTTEAIEVCDSRPFGQCQLSDGRTGICYNTRMQVLACLVSDTYIELRRFQIEKGVGQACDPVLEKWLGCGE